VFARYPQLILIVAAGLQCSCQTKQVELDLSEYPALPGTIASRAARAISKTNPYLRPRVLWGNYGGPGSLGAAPIDAMDELFRQHDLAYLQGIRNDALLESDQRLIAQLEALDPAQLSPEADAYRRRAIRYFSRSSSRFIGKSPDVLLGLKTRPEVIDTSSRK
jgi:hypothetical protein